MVQRTHSRMTVLNRDICGLDNGRGPSKRIKTSYLESMKEAMEMMSMPIDEIFQKAGMKLDFAVSTMRRHAEELESCSCKKDQAKAIYCKIGELYSSCGLFILAGAYYKKAEKWDAAGNSFMKSGDFMLAGKMFSTGGKGGMARKAFMVAAKRAEKNGEICHASRAYRHAGRNGKAKALDVEISAREERAKEITRQRAEDKIRKRNLGLCKSRR